MIKKINPHNKNPTSNNVPSDTMTYKKKWATFKIHRKRNKIHHKVI